MRDNDRAAEVPPAIDVPFSGAGGRDAHRGPVVPAVLTVVPRIPADSLARITLTAFLLTFMMTRALVYLIMSRSVPDLYVHVGGTHVHHLNFGIFILSGLGAYLLFTPARGLYLRGAAVAYGIGLALTFDEFGMWLHLGGSYWQRASFDAIVVIAGLLGLIASASHLRRYRPKHWATLVLLMASVAVFAGLLIDSFNYAGRKLGPHFEQLEHRAPQ